MFFIVNERERDDATKKIGRLDRGEKTNTRIENEREQITIRIACHFLRNES